MTKIMRKFSLAFIFGALACLAAFPARATNLLLNGGFETGDFTDWNLTGNLYAPGVNYTVGSSPTFTPEEGNYVALLGQDPSLGSTGPLTLEQSLSVSGLTSYTISFWLANTDTLVGTGNYFNVIFDGDTLQTQNNSLGTGEGAYTFYSYVVTTGASDTLATLEFDSDNTFGYWELDGISVSVSSSGAAPEPSTMLLAGMALMGASVALRRRRKS